MKNFFKKHGLEIELITLFVVTVINSVALLRNAIDFATGISVYAVLIAIAILFISVNEIRNRLRPWVAVASIEQELIGPNTINAHFYITNTGPIPATKVIYNVQWYVQENKRWKKFKKAGDSPFTSKPQILFPNQRIKHRVTIQGIETATYDTKVTFKIEYRGLWSKYTTTNTHRFEHINKLWSPDEPQDYT